MCKDPASHLNCTVQVWKFIVEREIEAPERFRAIQTYRATMAVLRQQVSFLDQLFDSGVIDEMEKEILEKWASSSCLHASSPFCPHHNHT